MKTIEKPYKPIGLVPAAGYASRLGELPFSKETLPIKWHEKKKGFPQPTLAIHHLLNSMRLAGIEDIGIITRKEKLDIISCLGNGYSLKINLAYFLVHETFGVPYTINQAYSWVRNKDIVFGFPDIVFEPENALCTLISEKEKTDADVMLGIFPAKAGQGCDLVEMDKNSRITRIEIKPQTSGLAHTWILAAWTPLFSRYINRFIKSNTVERIKNKHNGQAFDREITISEMIQQSIVDGVTVRGHFFQDGCFFDVGTPWGFKNALIRYFK